MPVLLYPYLGALPFLLALFAADRRTLFHARPLAAQLRAPDSFELGRDSDVQWTLTWARGLSGRQRQLKWQAPPSDLLAHIPHIAHLKLATPTTCTWSTLAHPVKLGTAIMAAFTVTLNSKLGLWTLALKITAADAAPWRVVPSRSRIPEQKFSEMLAQHGTLFQGARRLARSRAADQFHSVREYRYPDSIRHIDQRKSARYHKPMTRTYESYLQHHVVIALDLGRSMSGYIGQSAKLDYYLAAALNLADNAVRARDKVSFVAFGAQVTMTLRNRSTLAPFNILQAPDDRLQVEQTESNYLLIPQAIADLSVQRCIVVVLTDSSRPSIQAALLQALPAVCVRHLTVVLSLNSSAHNADQNALAMLGGPATRETQAKLLYSYWLEDEYARFRRQLSRIGGGAVMAEEQHWHDMTRRVYAQLRQSWQA